jgi:hypothetical protein
VCARVWVPNPTARFGDIEMDPAAGDPVAYLVGATGSPVELTCGVLWKLSHHAVMTAGLGLGVEPVPGDVVDMLVRDAQAAGRLGWPRIGRTAG